MFVKGQKVYLPLHKTVGTVNFISDNEICVKTSFGNVQCDTKGNLPHTDVKLIIPFENKFNENEIIFLKFSFIKEEFLVGGIIKELIYNSNNGEISYKVQLLNSNKKIINCSEKGLIKIQDVITKPDKY